MSSNLPEPQRWSDGSGRAGASAEDGIGASLRRARQATEPSDAGLTRVARGLDTPPPRSRAARLVLRAALVALLLVATGGAVGAMVLPPVAEALIRELGWRRRAYAILGAVILLVGLPLG